MATQTHPPAAANYHRALRRGLLLCAIVLLAGVALLAARKGHRRCGVGGTTAGVAAPQDAPTSVTEPPALAATLPAPTPEEIASLFAPGPKPLLPAWSLLDHVSLYQRSGFVENYGADFRERRSRPVAIDRSVLHVNHERAWLMWSPDRTPAGADAEMLEVAFAGAVPPKGTLTVGLLLHSGEVFLFRHEFAPPPPAGGDAAQLPPYFPADFMTAVSRSPALFALGRKDDRLRARLPAALRDLLGKNGDRAVRCWFLCMAGAAGSDVSLDHVSLLHPAEASSAGATVHLAGTVRGDYTAGSEVVAVLESGTELRQKLADGGKFALENVPADMPVSLRVEHRKQEYFATAGRWFMPGGDRTDLVIDMSPVYENPDKHMPDPKERFFHTENRPGIAEMFAVHSRRIWNGYEQFPQEFQGLSFHNNLGHNDRDRFYDNPDGCFRIVHLGSSHANACQLRHYDKYNIILEAELGVRLGRPVEVISLGRNNGDVAANYPRLCEFAVKFNPDVILFENCTALMMQLTPELLRRKFGYDHANGPFDNFYYDPSGKLTFRASAGDWPVHTQKPDTSDLIPGVPFGDTLSVPLKHMHPLGHEAYRYLADIMHYYEWKFPGQKFLLHTGLDQAQSHGSYGRTTKLPDGTVVPVGVEVFMKNMEEFCNKEAIGCVQPALPRGYNDRPETFLTFINDGHYSPRGHQWLARELAVGLIKELKLKDVTQPAP
jgi:hypothetical protein